MYTKPLERIIHRHGLQYHKYAADLQLYGQFDPRCPTHYTRLLAQLLACLADIRTWILKHLLKINDAKNQLVLFVNPQQERLISEKPTVILGDCVVHAAKTVRNLGGAAGESSRR